MAIDGGMAALPRPPFYQACNADRWADGESPLFARVSSEITAAQCAMAHILQRYRAQRASYATRFMTAVILAIVCAFAR